MPTRCWVGAVICAAALLVPVIGEAQGVTFINVTAASGIYGNYFHPAEAFPGGGAAGDFNNDGYQDLFVLGGYHADRLFINNGNGTFTDQAVAWGVKVVHWGLGAAVGDYNNDGWLDIYVTSLGQAAATGQHRLYRNEGGTHFTNQAAAAGVDTTSPLIADGFGSAFGDYDLDGDLDLFVAGWFAGSDGNRLFRNNGNGTFADVTSVLLGTITSQAFTPRFVDMNDDFYPELLIAADFGTSRYFRNNGGAGFTDFTAASGTGLDDNGMGQTVADYDGDGRLDWYVTSIYSPVMLSTVTPGTGNMLYMNQGNHSFVENAASASVSDGGWGWGVVSIDFDHDGDVDIVETNGWTNPEWTNESCYAYENTGNGTFVDASFTTGIAGHTLQGRGLVNFDYDNDGDQDLVIFSNNAPTLLYRCDLSVPSQNWLRVFLDTSSTTLAPNGFGSRVRVITPGQSQLRVIDGGCNYISQSELSAHFGMGSTTEADMLRVEWTNGIVSVLPRVAVNQSITVTAGVDTFSRGDCNGDLALTVSDAIYALTHIFGGLVTPPCLQACDANVDGSLDVSDPIVTLASLFGVNTAPFLGECTYASNVGVGCALAPSCP